MRCTTPLAGLILAVAPAQDAVEEAAAPARGTTASADGVEIAYEVVGDGAPTIVLVHGWSCSRCTVGGVTHRARGEPRGPIGRNVVSVAFPGPWTNEREQEGSVRCTRWD